MKKRIIYVPLENIEQRYSKMMNKAFEIDDISIVIAPEFNYPEVIESGQFLDVNKTIIYKTKQLQMIAEMFYKKEILDGDVFLIADMFFPGLESIKYMAELQDIKVQIFGFNYAGRADKNDFVQKLGKWADVCEKGYHDVCDGIFVGSFYHKNNILNHFNIDYKKIHVTGYIWDRDYVRSIFNEEVIKEDFVVFPHRLSSEKGIEEFLEFANKTDKKIVITSSGNKVDIDLPENVTYLYNLTKKQYYEVLARAKYYLSTAYQETFGYTLQEAIHFNCLIAVPNRSCYPEMVRKDALFDHIDDINFAQVKDIYTERWNHNAKEIIKFINN
jgi:glycosyltransferase involved in cell wall biosynthesis